MSFERQKTKFVFVEDDTIMEESLFRMCLFNCLCNKGNFNSYLEFCAPDDFEELSRASQFNDYAKDTYDLFMSTLDDLYQGSTEKIDGHEFKILEVIEKDYED